jgi:hypothetical protein
MRAARSGANLDFVTSTDPLHLALDLDTSAESIAGELVDAAGSPHSFWGWLELLALLDAAWTGGERESETPRQANRGAEEAST